MVPRLGVPRSTSTASPGYGSPRIECFGHIDLTITDGKRSARWWQEVMGFTLIANNEKPGWKQWNLSMKDLA